MTETYNGTTNELQINGSFQDKNTLPVIKLGNAGTILSLPIPQGEVTFANPFPLSGVPAIVDYTDINGGTTVDLNMQSNHRLVLTDLMAVVKTAITGSGGIDVGYTGAPAAICTMTVAAGASGTVTRVGTTGIVPGPMWGQQIPAGAQLTVKANGTLTAGSLWFCPTYCIFEAQD
jgi:hypothetical protein